MTRKIGLVALLLGCVYTLVAQERIKLLVVDGQTGEPLEMASLLDLRSGRAMITDKSGCFAVACRNTDTLVLSISCIGYRVKVLNLTSSDAPDYKIKMDKGPVSLKAVTIENCSLLHHNNPLSLIDLSSHPAKSAQDLLRLVPGLFIAQHQGGGKAEQIFVRGFDADHGTDVNISIDGMPVNMVSHAHGQGYADLHFLIPETVAGYDFGKGVYYSDKGDFTTAGYVAYTTKIRPDRNMVELEAGQFQTSRILGLFNLLGDSAKTKAMNAYVAADGLYSNGGPFDYPEHFKRLNLFGKFSATIGTNTRFSFELSTMTTRWEASGEIPNRAVAEGYVKDRFGAIDSFQGGVTSRSSLIAKLSTDLTPRLSLENLAYCSNYHFNLINNFTFYYSDSVHGDEFEQREKRNLAGYSIKLSDKKDLGSASLRSVAGVGFRYDAPAPIGTAHTENAVFLNWIQLGDAHELNTWAFLEGNLQVGRWQFNAGLRADYFDFYYLNEAPEGDTAALIYTGVPENRSKYVVCPKFNIQYKISPAWQLYVKTGKGFHSNDARVVIANQGYEVLPPAFGADLGIDWKALSGLWINAAAWWLFLRQEFTYGQDFGDESVQPSGRTVRKGLDLSARWEIYRWLFAALNVNVAKPRCIDSSKGHDYLALAPTFTSTASLDFRFPEGLTGAISYRYLHNRAANSDYSLTALGYFITDMTVNYSKHNFEVGLSVENLFNQVWDESQFAYLSRLKNEKDPVYEVSYTPGNPFFLKLKVAVFF